jgi:hypothetical protein
MLNAKPRISHVEGECWSHTRCSSAAAVLAIFVVECCWLVSAGGGKRKYLWNLLGGPGRKNAGTLGSVKEVKMARNSLPALRLTQLPSGQLEGRQGLGEVQMNNE